MNRTYQELCDAIDSGKSVILNGAHYSKVADLPSEASLVKGDKEGEARVAENLRAAIASAQSDLKMLTNPEPLDDRTHPSDLPEGDPRRYASTVMKDGDGEPLTPEQIAEAKSTPKVVDVSTKTDSGSNTGAEAKSDAGAGEAGGGESGMAEGGGDKAPESKPSGSPSPAAPRSGSKPGSGK